MNKCTKKTSQRDKQGRFLPRHAAYSRQIRRRYSDKRTREGKRLAAILDELRQEVGPDLSAGQSVILDRIREKLIVLIQIGAYVDKQQSVITHEGALLPCLGKGYTTYAESLRRDIEALYSTPNKRQKQIPTIRDLVEGKAGRKK